MHLPVQQVSVVDRLLAMCCAHVVTQIVYASGFNCLLGFNRPLGFGCLLRNYRVLGFNRVLGPDCLPC